jgi:hypothetical protein
MPPVMKKCQQILGKVSNIWGLCPNFQNVKNFEHFPKKFQKYFKTFPKRFSRISKKFKNLGLAPFSNRVQKCSREFS